MSTPFPRAAPRLTRGIRFWAALATLCSAWLAYQCFAWIGGAGAHRVDAAAMTLGALLAAGSFASPVARFSLWRPSVVTCVLVSAAASAAFISQASTGFLSDDFVLWRWASDGQFLSGSYEFIRPVPLLLWSAIAALGGGAGAAHALALALHAANGVGVATLASRAGLSAVAATATGILFAVWPLGAEPVVWISATPDLLITSAAIGSTLILLSSWAAPMATAALTAIAAVACLSKETGVVVPFVALLLMLAAGGSRVRLLTLIPAVVIAAAYAVFRLAIAPPGLVTPWTPYDLKEFVVRPFETLLVPVSGEVAGRFRAAFVLVNLSLAAALLWRIWTALKADTPTVPAWAYIGAVIVSVAPLQRYLYIAPDLEAARYLYCAAVPWTLLLGSIVDGLPGPRVLKMGAFAVMISLAALMLRTNLEPWVQAARIREGALQRIVRFVEEAPECGAIAVTDVPGVVRGAQVFRNGLPEAVQMVAPAVRLEDSAGADCTVSLGFPSASPTP